MARFWMTKIAFALAIASTSPVYSTAAGAVSPRQKGTLPADQRSTIMFRIVKDVGIKFDAARERAVRLIQEEEYTEARNVCSTFTREVRIVRISIQTTDGLTKEDLQYLDRSVARFQERIERVLDMIPWGM